MKNPVDILYRQADDAQKVWIELVNKDFRSGGLVAFRKSFDNHIEQTKILTDSILAKLLQKPKIVTDIGAGFGGIAVNLALAGVNVVAIEPEDKTREVISYFVSKYPQAKNKIVIKKGTGEKLPLENNSVDLCIVSQVLEHVKSPEKTMSEVARVLKPCGYLHLSSPNYLFPKEQHYHLFYLPLMPKKLFSRWALFLFKTLNIRNLRNSSKRNFSTVATFIDNINYTTDGMIKKLCLKNNLKIIWSARDKQKNVFNQITAHWQQDKTLAQIPLIIISLPLKIIRSISTTIGLLPMKLEYLIQKK